MKKRIWNQLKKAVMMTAAIGILGTGAASAAEFGETELSVPAVSLREYAEWTDEENFQAELTLEVSGLKELYKKEHENPNPEDVHGQTEETDVSAEENADVASVENMECKAETGDTESGSENIAVNEEGEEYHNEEENIKSEEYQNAEKNVGEEYRTEGENARGEEYLAEGESAEGKENQTEGEKTAGSNTENSRYFLTAYISEYFQVKEDDLKHDMQAESVQIQNQKGETTQITKLTCEVLLPDAETDVFSLKVPVSLREEYRISPVKVDYPLCQDTPLYKDQDGSGAYVWMKAGEEVQTMAVSPSVLLSVQEAKTGIAAQLQQETKEARAGQELVYILSVQNTGDLSLENIEISGTFSESGMKAGWKQEEGFTVNGMQGIITCLKAGEIRQVRMTVELTEEQMGEIIHTVTVKAKHPGKEENIECQKSVKTEITALKAAFEVEKTADRTQAYPGDTITYQICIRNTGERTLHSVLSTERFRNAGIQAKFVQKEGVTLNSSGTQALIPQIAQGEAFVLYATVTVPQYQASQELINEVTVTSNETGSQTITSQANVKLTGNDNTVTVTPQPTSAPVAVQSYGYESKSGNAYTAASKPRTGDETEIVLYIVLGIFALMSGVSAFCYMKTKKHQK